MTAASASEHEGLVPGSKAAIFPRYEQTFPELTPQEIERIARFGEPRGYKDGEPLFETGKPGPGMFVDSVRPCRDHPT